MISANQRTQGHKGRKVWSIDRLMDARNQVQLKNLNRIVIVVVVVVVVVVAVIVITGNMLCLYPRGFCHSYLPNTRSNEGKPNTGAQG